MAKAQKAGAGHDTGKVKRRGARSRETWRRLKKNKVAFVSLFILIALAAIALLADVIAPYP